MNPRTPLLPLLATLATLVLTACGGPASGDTSTTGQFSGDPLAACREAADVEARPVAETPLTAVLVSLGDPPSEGPEPGRTSYDKVLEAAMSEQARLLVETVGGDVGDAQLAVDTRLVPNGVNDLQRTQELCRAQEAARSGLESLLTSEQDGPVDVLGALQVLQSHLTGVERSRTDVVLLGNLVNTVGPIDLADPAALAAPDVAVDRVVARGLLPDCAGWRVYAVGGSPDGTSSEQDVQLREFWRTFFERCGGALVLWDRTLTEFPIDGVAVEPVTLTALPDLPPIDETDDTTMVTLPETMTFHSGSADLLPDADQALTRVLEVVQRHPESKVEITGHTDDVGDEIENDALGLRRARAVADWLVERGVDRTLLDVDTAGERDPAVPGTDDQARAANRRVVVLVHHGA